MENREESSHSSLLEKKRKEDVDESASVLLDQGLHVWQNRSIQKMVSGLSAASMQRTSIGLQDSALSVLSQAGPDYNAEERDFFNALLDAPQSSLVHLIMGYHQLLVKHHLQVEADELMMSTSQLMAPRDHLAQPELQGYDLLVKDGLFKLLLRISPYLPKMQAKILRFKDITYRMKREIQQGFDTLGKKLGKIAKGPLNKKHIVDVDVLGQVSGYIMPGTLTLVMGPVGCGKSTLHKVLSGRLHSGHGSFLSGDVLYNDKSMDEVKIRRVAGVADQEDCHLPMLTIRETLEFARNCSQYWSFKNYGPELQEMLGEALKIGQDPKLEMVLGITGLKRSARKLAGSATIPTTTPDERRRLTSAEMLAGLYGCMFFEELNAAQDVSVMYEFCQGLEMFCRVRQIGCLLSLLQPSPEVFNLFDRIILLSKGRVVFQGHRLDALPYFEQLGYVKPPHLDTTEFLEEVTTEEGQKYLKDGCEALKLDDFTQAFEQSELYADIMRIVNAAEVTQEIFVQAKTPLGLRVGPGPKIEDISLDGSLAERTIHMTADVTVGDRIVALSNTPKKLMQSMIGKDAGDVGAELANARGNVRLQLERPYDEPDSTAAPQFNQDYLRSWWEETKELTARQMKVTLRNQIMLRARLFQVLLLSLFTGTMFFRPKDNPNQLNMNLRRSISFISLIVNTLMNLGQMPNMFEERKVFYKQQEARFFRPSSYWAAHFLSGLPFTILEGTIWTCIVYFLTNLSLKDGGWHFFVFWLLVILIILHGASMVRALAYFLPDLTAASALSGLLIALLVTFAGFVIPRLKVPKYWVWFLYINPMQWGITVLLNNEFSSASYRVKCRELPETILTVLPQCANFMQTDKSIGEAFLMKGQFLTGQQWIGVGIAAIVAWIGIWNLIALRGMAAVRHMPPTLEGDLPEHELHERDESYEFREEDLEYAAAAKKKSGCPVTFIPINLSWHDISYEIQIPVLHQVRKVLNAVSGWAKSGELVALLGASGSGKTTLLNCLSGRYINEHNLSGEVLANGYAKEAPTFARVMGYVDKQDAYSAFLTVREALEFSAAMRLGDSQTAEHRSLFVEEVLTIMEMQGVENRLVGALRSSITREQGKRLAIAVELAGNPSIMFLDEPTAGLDSKAANHVLHCLRNIANSGRTVIAAVNNPSFRMSQNFHTALILNRSGDTVYFGPLGDEGASIVKHFTGIPGVRKPPVDRNPYSFALEVIGDGVNRKMSARDFGFEYRVSDLAMRNSLELQQIRRSKGELEQLKAHGFAASNWLQFTATFMRMQKQYWRNNSYSFGRLMSSVILGLLLGSVFWQDNTHTTPSMNSKAGEIFILNLLIAIGNAQNVVPQVVAATANFKRERSTRLYQTFFYNLAFGLAEIPYLIVTTLVMASITCTMSNLATDNAGQFFQFWFIMFEFTLSMTYFAMLIAFAIPFPPAASMAVSIVISVMIPSSGLVLVKQKFQKAYIWLFWSNPFQYALSAMTSLVFFCNTNTPQCQNGGKNVACAHDPTACPLCTCPRISDARDAFVWDTIRNSRSLDHSAVGLYMFVLFLFIVLFRLLAYAALTRLRHNRSF